MSSVYVVCCIFLQTFQTYFAYRQTVWTQIRLLLEEQSDLGPHCLQQWLLKYSAEDKADDSCCVWRLRIKDLSLDAVSMPLQLHLDFVMKPLHLHWTGLNINNTSITLLFS